MASGKANIIYHFLSSILGVFAALVLFLFMAPNGFQSLSHSLGMVDLESERVEIENTIKTFNSYYAKFFNTGGDLEGLGDFPAANMIKRRMVQEINSWKSDNKVIVYDKNHFELKDIKFVRPDLAVALADEVWFLMIKRLSDRLDVSRAQNNSIKVRYIVSKWDGQWRVMEYEVFGIEEELPAFQDRRSLR